MTLAEALASSKLSLGHLITGHDALDCELTWVSVVDQPDMEKWVQPGHLLLTTGYHWPKSDAEAAGIIETLHRESLAGVVLAAPQYLDHFPPASIEAARALGFPLIELPWDIPFSEVTQAVHREIIDRQARLILRSEKIHSTLTRTALDGAGLQDLADTLGSLLERPVYFCDMAGRTLGSHAPAGCNYNPDEFGGAGNRDKSLMGQLDQLGWLGKIRDSRTPVQIPRIDALNLAPRIAYPIRIRGELLGLAWVIETGLPLGELDIRAVEHAGTVASLMLAHQRELSAQEARLGYAFIDSLLEGRFEPTPAALERARLLGWEPNQNYKVCAVLLDEPLPLSREGFLQREAWAESLKRYLTKEKVPVLLSMSLNQITFLVPDAMSPEDIWAAIGNGGSAMAVSRVASGAQGMQRAAEDIAVLLPILRRGKVHRFEEMLLTRVLQGDAEARKLFVAKVFGPLRQGRRSDASIQTLITLIEEGFHLAQTAKRLGLHISTLRYRVQQLQELLQVSFDDPEARFRLQVAVRLYTLLPDEQELSSEQPG
jgi:purine catabolism regulator